jgi:glycosyltransferase involved in cell wall biosynthesis
MREFDAVWTVCDDDRCRAVSEGSNPDRTYAIPNGVDTRRFVPEKDRAEEPEVLFVGSFRHFPNVLGFETLCRKIMPLVWSQFPNIRLRVVAGPHYQEFWQKSRTETRPLAIDDRITILGFVEDLRPLYAAARAVVVPLDVSAGTNIKVLEAMACGKAIVATPKGCAGLGVRNGQEALICSDPGEFALALCAILSDADLRSRLSRQARQSAEERFSWTMIAEAANESYATLAARRDAGRTTGSLALSRR